MYELSSHDITKLAKAMLQVQAEIAPAAKDSKNPFVGNTYASLNSVMGVCSGLLQKYGILLLQLPVPAPAECGPGYLALMTKLVHVESGQWVASVICSPLPKSDPQGYGSALTYSRRYGLAAMLGILTEDDDGNAASNTQNTGTSARQAKNGSVTQKAGSDRQSQGGQRKNGLKRLDFDFDSLPQLDGVEYQVVTADDGRDYVLALGNTFSKKEVLQGAGFHWNKERKCWWKYADVA